MYNFLRRIFFLLPPEWVHYASMNTLKFLCAFGPVRQLISACYRPSSKSLEKNYLGLKFKNPVGLGAGFDKNARYLRELETLGFGFVEIGTVTPIAQEGNPKPRLFRLPTDQALINRMGFNNDGVTIVAERLKAWREHPSTRNSKLIVGGNIGKNKVTPNEEAWKDYDICFRELHPYVDYFVVNVSSPNTPGLRELQEKESLRKILRHLQMINNGKAKAKPILLKIAPDLSQEQVDDVVNLALEIKLDGLVSSNTTIDRSSLSEASVEIGKETGGLSGKPLQQKSTELLKYITVSSKQQFPVIASGGIFEKADATEKFAAGAALIQVWTGFIYKGPGIVKQICNQ